MATVGRPSSLHKRLKPTQSQSLPWGSSGSAGTGGRPRLGRRTRGCTPRGPRPCVSKGTRAECVGHGHNRGQAERHPGGGNPAASKKGPGPAPGTPVRARPRTGRRRPQWGRKLFEGGRARAVARHPCQQGWAMPWRPSGGPFGGGRDGTGGAGRGDGETRANRPRAPAPRTCPPPPSGRQRGGAARAHLDEPNAPLALFGREHIVEGEGRSCHAGRPNRPPSGQGVDPRALAGRTLHLRINHRLSTN